MGNILVLKNVTLKHSGSYYCTRYIDLGGSWNKINLATLEVLGKQVQFENGVYVLQILPNS